MRKNAGTGALACVGERSSLTLSRMGLPFAYAVRSQASC